MKIRSVNPATEKLIGEVESAGKKSVNEAVERARRSFPDWSMKDLSERAEILSEAAGKIKSSRKSLSLLITREMGKPIKEAEDEVDGTASDIKWFAKEGKKCLEREEVNLGDFTVRGYITFEPYGVAGAITPWNFPLSTSLYKIVPALLTGNTVVWKPSELTPFVSIELFRIFRETGLPEGVFNLVVGDDNTGKFLVDSKVDMISFAGSLKKVVMELGGSDPFILCKDADLEDAIEGAASGRFYNCGQVCCADKRFYVEEEISGEFMKRFAEKVKKLKIGDPLDASMEIGPLASSSQRQILEGQIRDAIGKGAKVLCGGKRPADSKGYFYLPTVLSNVNHKMKVMKEEVFGPVAPVISVRNVEHAIKLANDTIYGLGASIWTMDGKKAEKIARQLQVGTVWINGTNMFYPEMPWGGVKQSGIGKESSKYGILEFVNIKPVIIKKR